MHSPESSVADEQLNQYEAMVQQVASLSSEVEQMTATLETQLLNLNNVVGRQNQDIRALQLALPDPPPVIEEDVLHEMPPAAIREPPPSKVVPPVEKDQAPEQEGIQSIAKRLAMIENDLRDLPSKIERGAYAVQFASNNPQRYLPYAATAAVACCLLSSALTVALLHLLPAPLSARNEGQLFQIYQKIH
jgi:hypothetical protein